KPLGHPSASGMKARNRCLMVRHGSGILCLCAAGKSKNAKNHRIAKVGGVKASLMRDMQE
ncbi:MAG: hypothetical protein KDJ66_11360, partial [Nitratireductor sp.]|nr:hypothetical protein [Nitratireductor sp.]